ncbi:MAG: gliding motility-associated C-terminal domain-containing protein [Chitinophagales bacterium]|nr:gliding motility-associated C-terminal domain-containing protein [Chitinophagales bacterium]
MKAVKAVTVILLSVAAGLSYAQTPTNQDCLGAIPICSPVYVTTSATFGTGNYPAEHPPSTCLIPGEYNSLWFIFTVISSGNLAFEIVPVSPFADYDWALYNLTNASCADIKTNSSLSVSCNSSQYGYTGISATGVGNWNGPGPTNAFNYLYPVNAGETYVLNVNNWSGTTGGYTINFSNSTATIFDSVKPKLFSVVPPACNSSQIIFSFSEKVLCSSVSAADFSVNGPQGNHTVTAVSGAACSVGGSQEITFTATVSPPLSSGGTYSLLLTSAAGSVEDLCGNLADTATFSFQVNGVQLVVDSIKQPFCAGNNGAIYASAVLGSPPYSFTVNGQPAAGSILTGLNGGTFLIKVVDANGCSDTAQVTLFPPTGAVSAQLLHSTPALCADSCNATALVSGNGGVPPYSFSWSNGASSSGVAHLCAGTYTVTVTDLMGCSDAMQLTVSQPAPLQIVLDSISHVSCYGEWNGYAAMSVTGGTPPYFYTWLPYGGNSKVADNLNANDYVFQVKDFNKCFASVPVKITQPAPLKILYPGDLSACLGEVILLEVPVDGGTPPYAVLWSDGSTDMPYAVTLWGDTVLQVVATDANGCQSSPANYRVSAVLPVVLDLGADTVLCLGDAITLTIPHDDASVLWQDGSTAHEQTIHYPGTYWVRVFNDCFSASDTLRVEMEDCSTCLHFPDAFTPNQDGINDVFLPINRCTLSRYRLQIFNRWGMPVFSSSDINQGWDGRHGGRPAEVGTYVWQAEYSGQVLGLERNDQRKGFVVLIR